MCPLRGGEEQELVSLSLSLPLIPALSFSLSRSGGQLTIRENDPSRAGKQLLNDDEKRTEVGIRRMAERRGQTPSEKRGYHLAYLAYAYLKTDVRIPARAFFCAGPGARNDSQTMVRVPCKTARQATVSYRLRKMFRECTTMRS